MAKFLNRFLCCCKAIPRRWLFLWVSGAIAFMIVSIVFHAPISTRLSHVVSSRLRSSLIPQSSQPSSLSLDSPHRTESNQGQVLPRGSSPLPSVRINSERLLHHLTQVAVERATELDRQTIRHYLIQTLETAGWHVRQQVFTATTPMGEQKGINIIAELPESLAADTPLNQNVTGRLPAAALEKEVPIVLVGAHYDSISGSPGADDNATGVAAVLELAQVFNPDKYHLPLKFVLFDLEEVGLFGSEAFVADAQEREGVKGAIILEMLGYRCATEGCQSYPPLPITPPSKAGDFLAVVGDRAYPELINSFANSNAVPVYTLAVPTLGFLTPDLLRSDHVPFWKRGISAVMVTDTANFRNPHYHQASDRPDTIDSAFFVAATQAIVEAITQILSLPRL